jgi:hypothetical protein
MRIGKTAILFAIGLQAVIGVMATRVFAGPAGMIRLVMGGENIDLAVRQVTVAPVRGYVGQKVHVEVLIENKDEGRDTTSAEIFANGKRVGSRLFAWGSSAGERLYRLSFDWDTRGLSPGVYKIRAEAPVDADTSPSDNSLEVKQPVILILPGASFPDGQPAGGTATETDPQFDKTQLGG